MKKSIIMVATFLLLSLIFSVSAFAQPRMVHPLPGEGPVQVAERYGVDIAEFIKLNRDRFVNPKRVSLVYTWQEFILPESRNSPTINVPVQKPAYAKKSLPDKEAAIASVVNHQAAAVTITQQSASEKREVRYLAKMTDLKITVLEICMLMLLASVVVMVLGPTFPNAGLRLPHLSSLGGGALDFFRHLQFPNRNSDTKKFICKCKNDGAYAYVDEQGNFMKFPGGLSALAKYLIQECEKKPTYAVPAKFADRYDSFDNEERLALEGYKEKVCNSA